MESLAAYHDEDWDSFYRMFSNEEGHLDFMQQILHQFSFPPQHDERLSFINPSAFCPDTEANMSIVGVSENLFSSSNALDGTYFLGDSNHIAVANDIAMSLEVSKDIDGVNDKISDLFPPAFPNIAMGGAVNVIEDLSTDCLPKLDGGHPADNANELLLKRKFHVLELHDEWDKISTNSSRTTEKRPRLPKYAAKVWKNVQPNKNRKNNLNGNEESNIGGDGQSCSTSSSDDDNVSQDNTNGVALATSESKESQALNLNGKRRASRGSATDPQSLYARKRRERINERLRILQNLVPNGTKVDISTMLEDAVHYVKFLQLQIKLLSSDELWMYAPIAYNGVDVARAISTASLGVAYLIFLRAAMAMASSEQPLKKRRLFDPPPETYVALPTTPPPLSQEEILSRRRNRDEIRSVYENYKRIKSCISMKGKDARYMPGLEQAYLALITVSRGCLSVQRLVADFVPRYASYCPTALEAATKAIIDVHNSTLVVISREEDADNVAFQTAKACIFGLADICSIASIEAPRSLVARGICSTVFQNVLSFLIASFNGKDLFQIVNKDICKFLDSDEMYSELKQTFSDEDESSLIKLSKFRALSLLWILFPYPKKLLSVCFELFRSSEYDEADKGLYFLRQATGRLDDLDANCAFDKLNIEPKSCADPLGRSTKGSVLTGETPGSDSGNVVEDAAPVLRSSLLGLPNMISRSSNQHETSSDQSGRGKSSNESCVENLSGLYLNPHTVPPESNFHVIAGFSHDGGGSRSMDFERHDRGDLSSSMSSVPRDPSNHQLLSPATGTPRDFRSTSFEGRNHFKSTDMTQVSNSGGSSALKSTSGGVSNALASPSNRYAASSQSVWYFDSDPSSMGIFSASRQLWLGSLGADASEGYIRFELERFGPIEQFFFFPVEGFALVEYRSIIDAVRAREYIRSCFPWRVMFMDIGLGTRGSVNGVAVGSSSHVYVGNISSLWAKDETLHESRKVVYKGPYMVIDLTCECALLLEYESPEEAAAVMAHLRQHRKERSSHTPPFNVVPPAVSMLHVDSGRSDSAPPIHADIKNNTSAIMSSSSMELVSPKLRVENHGTPASGALPFQSNWPPPGCTDMPEGVVRKVDGYDNHLIADPAQGGGVPVSGASAQVWNYQKPESELHSAPGSMPCMPIATQSLAPPPPPQLQAPPFMRPVYHPPNSSWDARGFNHQFPQNPISPGVVPNTFHGNAVPPPFVSASVTPLSQMQGPPMQHFEQRFPHPVIPPPLSSMPPPPPVPPLSPPPLPQSLPPLVPPLPNSPPPPIAESTDMDCSEQCVKYQWQGSLCKSGAQYCTIYAQRLDSDLCKYSNASSEPAEWPAKLDMTKRTDFRHVKSTFTNTPPHKREVCCLIPSSAISGFYCILEAEGLCRSD
ncbi:hypothetical protein V6N13_144092 [Hibiscus sabdariffa]